MNERIKGLAVRSGVEHTQNLGVEQFYFEKEELEKFARYIIEECCNMMAQAQDDITSLEPSEVNWGYVSQLQDWIDRFEKHFGVSNE